MNTNQKYRSIKLSGYIFTKLLEYNWDMVEFTRTYLNSDFKKQLVKCADELKLKDVPKTDNHYDKNNLFWLGEMLQSWYIDRYLA